MSQDYPCGLDASCVKNMEMVEALAMLGLMLVVGVVIGTMWAWVPNLGGRNGRDGRN